MEHKDRQLKSGSCHLWPTFYWGWCEKQWWSSCPTWQPDVYHPIYCWWSSPPGRSAEQAAQWQPGELSWIRALSTLAPPTPITWPGHSGWNACLSWLTNRLVLMFSSVFRLWDWTLSWILHSVIPQMQLLARLPKRDSPSLATRQAGSKVANLCHLTTLLCTWPKLFNSGKRCDSLSKDRETQPTDLSRQRGDPVSSSWQILSGLLLVCIHRPNWHL